MSASSSSQHSPCLWIAALSMIGKSASRVLRAGVLQVVLLFGATLSDVAHAQTVPTLVTVEILSANPITVPVNRPVAEPIRILVRNAQSGLPVAGVVVDTYLNYLFCIPLHPDCAAFEVYVERLFGGFGLDPDGASGSQATTDAAGIATVTGFHSGVIAGSYELIVGVYPSNTGGLFQSTQSITLLGVVQTSVTRTIPATDSHSLILLVALLALAGLVAVRSAMRD